MSRSGTGGRSSDGGGGIGGHTAQSRFDAGSQLEGQRGRLRARMSVAGDQHGRSRLLDLYQLSHRPEARDDDCDAPDVLDGCDGLLPVHPVLESKATANTAGILAVQSIAGIVLCAEKSW